MITHNNSIHEYLIKRGIMFGIRIDDINRYSNNIASSGCGKKDTSPTISEKKDT